MARQPHEFGVPKSSLDPQHEPMGFLQNGLFPANSVNILDLQLQAEATQAARQSAMDNARQMVSVNAQWDRDFPYGAIVKPEHNTLRGYKYILKQGGGVRDVQFSPRDYGIFDGIIAKEAGIDHDTKKYTGVPYNQDHAHYEDYAALRRNIAILRNYLLVTMLPSGKGDGRNYAAIRQMAHKLGKALDGKETNPSFITRWSHSVEHLVKGEDMSAPETNAFLQAANVPDRGIEVMYNYLYDRRNTPVSFFPNPIKYVMSKPWDILPIEQTPFSATNMLQFDHATVMVGIANAFENVVGQLHNVDTLSEDNKAISVEHARNILEKLRITLGNAQEESSLNVITDSKQAEAEMLLRVALAYKDALAGIARIDPNMLKDPMLADAIDALGQIDYMMKLEAEEALKEEGRTDEAKVMASRISAMPKRAKPQPIATLVGKLKTGINEAARITHQHAPAKTVHIAKAKTPAQQAVHASSSMFSAGSKVKQVSSAHALPLAQKVNEEQQSPVATPQRKDQGLGGPSAPGRK